MWIHKHEPRGHEKPLFALLCHYARLASITQSRFPIYARPSRILVVQITTRICLLSTFDLYLDRYQISNSDDFPGYRHRLVSSASVA